MKPFWIIDGSVNVWTGMFRACRATDASEVMLSHVETVGFSGLLAATS